jgi:hypothetical protein
VPRRLGLANNISIDAAHQSGGFDQYTIVVLVPCYNEEVSVAKVVKDFRAVLPRLIALSQAPPYLA